MRIIKLTKGKIAFVDDEDYDYLSQWRWKYNTRGYACRNKRMRGSYYKTILMHREILNAKGKKHIDHINRNKLDNRKSNLRYCTPSQNYANTKARKTNKLGMKGVSKSKRGKGYIAQIQKSGIKIYLGYFKTPLEASSAYKVASSQLNKEFSYYNNVN